MAQRESIHIGTSGWNYPHWNGPFYPDRLRPPALLPFYRQRFSTVEINNSFYKLPTEETFAAWRAAAGDDFLFAVKASRFITHMKKLKDPQEPIARLMSRLKGLGPTLGPILFQLPPRWNCNVDRLAAFLEALPEGHRFAFEFRDERWWNADVYRLLRRHNAAFCIFDKDGRQTPKELTADFAYVRLHGPGLAYHGRYGGRRLLGWVGTFLAWLNDLEDIYCYFDNDQNGYAPQDALKLKELLDAARTVIARRARTSRLWKRVLLTP